jgi:hypothetical protein
MTSASADKRSCTDMQGGARRPPQEVPLSNALVASKASCEALSGSQGWHQPRNVCCWHCLACARLSFSQRATAPGVLPAANARSARWRDGAAHARDAGAPAAGKGAHAPLGRAGRQTKRQKKRETPAYQLRLAVVEAVRARDPAAALAAYDAAVAQGAPLAAPWPHPRPVRLRAAAQARSGSHARPPRSGGARELIASVRAERSRAGLP